MHRARWHADSSRWRKKFAPRRTLSRLSLGWEITGNFAREAPRKLPAHRGARVVPRDALRRNAGLPERLPHAAIVDTHAAVVTNSWAADGRVANCRRAIRSAVLPRTFAEARSRQRNFLVTLHIARMSAVINYSPNVAAASEYFSRRYAGLYLKIRSLHGASRTK